jgi:hypothetical protein
MKWSTWFLMSIFMFSCAEYGDVEKDFSSKRSALQTIQSTWEFSPNTKDTNRKFGNALVYGDFDGDGSDDVAVGTPYKDGTTLPVKIDQGIATVFKGNSSVDDFRPQRKDHQINAGWLAADAYALVGFSVCAGDFNGDGEDDIAVGQPGNASSRGKVIVLYGDPDVFDDTAWGGYTEIAGGATGDAFGYAVACGHVTDTSHEDLIVSAPYTTYGTIYVFKGQAAGINTTPVITSDGGTSYRESGSLLGASLATVDIRGRSGVGYFSIVAGQPGKTVNSKSLAGQALVWYGGSTINNVVDEAWNRSRGAQAGEFLGFSVADGGDFINTAAAENEILIGAPKYDSYNKTDCGQVYVVNDNGNRVSMSVLGCTGCDNYNYFGYSVHGNFNADGDSLVDFAVGEPGYNSSRGRARVYEYSVGYAIRQTISGVSNTGEECGSALAAGNMNNDDYDDLSIGCSGPGDDTYLHGNRVINLLGSNGGLVDADLDDFGGSHGDSFAGRSVAAGVSGTTINLVVGSPYHDTATYDNCGAAFMTYGTSSGGLSINSWISRKWEGARDDELFGQAMVTGDFDGDGDPDLAIGAPGDGSSGDSWGRVVIYDWGATGYPASVSKTLRGNDTETDDMFGYALSAGNVNDDDYDDLLVGAPYENTAYLFLGSATGLDTDAAWERSDGNDIYGWNVAIVGDVDMDGDYNDWVVVERDWNFNNKYGKIFLYQGEETIVDTIEALDDITMHEMGECGTATSLASGFGTQIIGTANRIYVSTPYCVYDSTESTFFGKIWVLSYLDDPVNAIIESGEWYSEDYWQLGYGMALGNFDGSGSLDLAVSASETDEDDDYPGDAWLFVWEDVGSLGAAPDYQLRTDYTTSDYGFRGNSVADVDGDDKDDLLTGDPEFTPRWRNKASGRSYLILGTSSGLDH